MPRLELELENRLGRLTLRPRIDIPGITAVFTTRVELTPRGPRFCNYGFYGIPGAAKGRARLCEGLGLDARRLTAGEQTHTAAVALVTEEIAGRGGLDKKKRIPNTDGLATNLARAPLAVMTADCVPVLFADPVARAVAAVHAGWRGSMAGILANAVGLMRDSFGSKPKNIIALVGPRICSRCYEIGEELAVRISEPKSLIRDNSRLTLDLAAWNESLLKEAGVLKKNIHIADLCTACNTELLYSYRADKRKMGSNASVIFLL